MPSQLDAPCVILNDMRYCDGLRILAQAATYSQDVQCDIWEFAVELQRLTAAGLASDELRWLLKKGYLQHRIETTEMGDASRRFCGLGSLKFDSHSCFVLTGDGMRALSKSFGVCGQPRPVGSDVPTVFAPTIESSLVEASRPPKVPQELPSTQPHWDTERRELWFGPRLIKRFPFRSPNQEMILAAFDEEGWPPRVDDPLFPVPNQTTRQRLHDAIKNLNRHHVHRIIRFGGDGTGEGVRWEMRREHLPQIADLVTTRPLLA